MQFLTATIFPASFETPAPFDSTHERDYGTTDIGSHRFVGLVLDTSSELIAVRSNASLARLTN